jgi:hypothetical protein
MQELAKKEENEKRPLYKSDVNMSQDEIIQGLMEISALSLPDEPHKYHSACSKT